MCEFGPSFAPLKKTMSEKVGFLPQPSAWMDTEHLSRQENKEALGTGGGYFISSGD